MASRRSGSAIGYDVVVEGDRGVVARDGTRLATDVYRPALRGKPAPGRFPTLVERTPYDRRRAVLHQAGHFFARRGYVAVAQDVRGRHASEGDWRFLAPVEGTDGYDTLAWIAAQPWSDGRIGTMGLSYSTANQQALALLRPPALAAQFLGDGGYDFHHRTLRHSGAFELGIAFPYALRVARESRELAQDATLRAAFEAACAELPEWLRRLPLRWDATPLRVLPEYERWFLELLRHGDYDDYWKHAGWNLAEHIGGYPDIPLLLQTSWYGHHVWATTEKFKHLRERSRSATKLLIGPWLHGYDDYARGFAGEVELGVESLLDLNDLKLRFFDQSLKGLATGFLEEPRVRIFVMGGGSGRRNREGRLEHGGRWRGESTWPLARARWTRLFLHGSGRLEPQAPPPDAPPSRYVFDPTDPVPTIGAGVQSPLFPGLIQGGGFDQRGRRELWACRDTRPLAERADVLVFVGEALTEDLEVTGPVSVRLWVASSAADTDFTAKLIDLYPPSQDWPEGFALNLTDGILRARYRGSRERAEPLRPGDPVELALELQATSNLFRPGHRLRLDVSSSNFPRFDVNSNTGEPLGRETRCERATNVVFHDAGRPSHVLLPVVPG